MVDRLDEERIEILRSWGLGLGSDDREELRAAGKAITVLIEEIDRLHIDLWNTRVAEIQAIELETDDDDGAEIPAQDHQAHDREPLVATTQGSALRDRLARIRPHA
jgi:hypothetical protein